MVIHDLKHPLDALQVLHESFKTCLEQLRDKFLFMGDKIIRLAELDTANRPLIMYGTSQVNRPNLSIKRALSPLSHLKDRVARLFDDLDPQSEVCEQYFLKVSNPNPNTFRL